MHKHPTSLTVLVEIFVGIGGNVAEEEEEITIFNKFQNHSISINILRITHFMA